MGHTTEELIFAAMVAKAAQGRRAWIAAQQGVRQDEEWLKENPMEKFVPDVLEGFHRVADEIKRLDKK